MTPDTLAHIVKDVKIDEVRIKINDYQFKLMAFKANTKLRELIDISFPVPDYCEELTIMVEESCRDKTIQEVEDGAVNFVPQSAHGGSPHIRLGWKRVHVAAGSICMTFIIMESASSQKRHL